MRSLTDRVNGKSTSVHHLLILDINAIFTIFGILIQLNWKEIEKTLAPPIRQAETSPAFITIGIF
jgi:hypothetical protein